MEELKSIRRKLKEPTSATSEAPVHVPSGNSLQNGAAASNDSPASAGSMPGSASHHSGSGNGPSAWMHISGTVKGNKPSNRRAEDESFPNALLPPAADPGKVAIRIENLALLLGIIGVGILFMEPEEAYQHQLAKTIEPQEVARAYRQNAETALTFSRWVDSPTVTALQAIIVLRIHYMLGFRIGAMALINATGIRAAAMIGLHRLGSAADDAARWQKPGRGAEDSISERQLKQAEEEEQTGHFPPWAKPGWHNAHVREYCEGDHAQRELGRKVWYALITVDWTMSPRFDQFYVASVHTFTTKLPSNLDDHELYALEPYSPLPPIDRDKPTDRAYLDTVFAISDISRKITDDLNRGDINYDMIMRADGEIRQVLSNLPWYYSFDGSPNLRRRLHEVMTKRPITSVQRVLAHMTCWHTLLRMHRRYMALGFADPMYAHSTQTCIEAAQFVIAVVAELDRAHSRARKLPFNTVSVFHSCMVLQIDINRAARGPITPVIAQKREAVRTGITLLENSQMALARPGFPIAPLAHFKDFVMREEQARNEWESEMRRTGRASNPASPDYRGPSAAGRGRTSSTSSPLATNAAIYPSSGPMRPGAGAQRVPAGGAPGQNAGSGSVPVSTANSTLDTTPAISYDDFDEVLRSFLAVPAQQSQQQLPAQQPQQQPDLVPTAAAPGLALAGNAAVAPAPFLANQLVPGNGGWPGQSNDDYDRFIRDAFMGNIGMPAEGI